MVQTMNSISADVFNHHIMPAACESQTLRTELARVRNLLESKTSMNQFLRLEMMTYLCSMKKLLYHHIYGVGDTQENDFGIPKRGIDDFRVNIVGGETLKEYRVFKLVESPVPTAEQTTKLLVWWGNNLTDATSIQILTAEERQAELIPMHCGLDAKAFIRPELIYCMDFMHEEGSEKPYL